MKHEIFIGKKATGKTDVDIRTEIIAIFSSDNPDCDVTTFELLDGDSDITLNGFLLEI